MSDSAKVAFKSGATSGGRAPRYALMTWEGVKRTAARYAYGNEKHEAGDTVLSNANWLKAFHDRDLAFWQDRFGHAIDHLRDELGGKRDANPGGNLGGAGWGIDTIAFVAEHDPEFYDAVCGRRAHPGKRVKDCGCPRCQPGDGTRPEPPKNEALYCAVFPKASPFPPVKIEVKSAFPSRCTKCGGDFVLGHRFCCDRCEECCTCL